MTYANKNLLQSLLLAGVKIWLDKNGEWQLRHKKNKFIIDGGGAVYQLDLAYFPIYIADAETLTGAEFITSYPEITHLTP